MTKFTYRNAKRSPLTHKELDDNFRRVEQLHRAMEKLYARARALAKKRK